ncbi:MAG: hypothetical protein R3B48_03700 [Kofleriaceae bacterium]
MLSAFARARRLTTLDELTAEWTLRAVTRAVLDELGRGKAKDPTLGQVHAESWLTVVPSDSLEDLRVFGEYSRVLGSSKKNIGEASILAWAEVQGGIVIIDDAAAVAAAKSRGVKVRRSLALLCDALERQRLRIPDASRLVDDLIRGGARFPCDGVEFERWAKANGLISD